MEIEGTVHQHEKVAKKNSYPKSVFFIIACEFCERFCFYGMKTVLNLYLRDHLSFSEHASMIIYHSFVALAYFFSLLGAIIADGFIGKFKTILILSIVYTIGVSLLMMSALPALHAASRVLCIGSLFLIAAGTGGIKPCVSAFGADQFHLPRQQHYLDTFFALFYFTINTGSFVSTLTTPLMRKFQCLKQSTCFPLAFAVPAILMGLSIVLFVAGKRFYRILRNSSDVILEWAKCVCHAIGQKCKSKDKVAHWLDRSKEKFGEDFVADVKTTFYVLKLFIPIPLFWSLFDQQGSGWTFQASKMDTRVGSLIVLPDQMQLVNAVLILVLIPVFTYGIYPICEKFGFFTRPLTRIAVGGIFAACAFIVSACVSLNLEAGTRLPGRGYAFVKFYNLLENTVVINGGSYIKDEKIESFDYKHLNIKLDDKIEIEIVIDNNANKSLNVVIKEESTIYCYLKLNEFACHDDDPVEDSTGFPKVRILLDQRGSNQEIFLNAPDSKLKINSTTCNYFLIQEPGSPYKLEDFDNTLIFLMGGVYVVLVEADGSHIKKVKVHEIVEHNTLSVLWQLPQYFLITIGEILLSITALEFSYVQAPKSMKSFVTAMWLLTTAIGNILIVVIEAIQISKKASTMFFIYGSLMLADMILFILLSRGYHYVETVDDDDD